MRSLASFLLVLSLIHSTYVNSYMSFKNFKPRCFKPSLLSKIEDREAYAVGDIIAYEVENRKAIGVINEKGLIQKLKLRGDDDNNSFTFHENDDMDPVSYLTVKIIRKFADSDVYMTQRIVEDRVSNPHGEHAEDVWILKTNEISSVDIYSWCT